MRKILLIFSIILNWNFIFTTECERAKLEEKCYGECGNFTDKNNNGICDVWEKYHKDKENDSLTTSIKNNESKNKSKKRIFIAIRG